MGIYSNANSFSVKDVLIDHDIKGKMIALVSESFSKTFSTVTSYLKERIYSVASRINSGFVSSDGYSLENINEYTETEKSKFDFIRKEIGGAIESGYFKIETSLPLVSTGDNTENTIVSDRKIVVEKEFVSIPVTREIVSSLGFYNREEVDEAILKMSLAHKNELLSLINNLSTVSDYRYSGNTQAIALTNKIDNLSNVTISNAIMSGVSGLTDADIPDGITALNYFPLSGGNLTGKLGIGTTSPYAPLSVVGEAVASFYTSTGKSTSTFASGIELTDGCFSINGICVAGGSVSDGTFSTTSADNWFASADRFSTTSTNFAVNTFVSSSTTIPKTYTANTFTGINNFNGKTNLTNASSTLFSVTGSAWLGTLTGPIQAINGLVSATNTLSVSYGGTGISTLPTYGQVLLGNSSGGYTLTATSSLGITAVGDGTFSTTSADYWLTLNQGDAFSTTSAQYFLSTATGITRTLATASSTSNVSLQTTETLIQSVIFTPASLSNSIVINMDLLLQANTNQARTGTIYLRRGSCTTGTLIGFPMQYNSPGNNIGITLSQGFTLVDKPNTISSVTYSVCGTASLNNSISAVDRTLLLTEINGAVVGADLAEIYPTNDPTLKSGEIVSIDKESIYSGVKRSSGSYDKDAIGIITTKPGYILGDDTSVSDISIATVALAGRVPLLVNNENGPIRIGDMLTSSSEAGVAMRATKAGQVIAQALSGYGGDNSGIVIAFIKMEDFGGADIEDIIPGLSVDGNSINSINSESTLKTSKEILSWLKNTSESNTSNIESEIFTDRISAGLEIISPRVVASGLILNSISAVDKEIIFNDDIMFFGRPYFNSDTGGFAIIKTGARKVNVEFEREFVNNPVVNASITTDDSFDSASVESLFSGNIKYAITNLTSKGFTLTINKTSDSDIHFSWMALAIKNAKTFSSKTEDFVAPLVSSQTANLSSSEINDENKIPPVITLNGNNPARLSVGSVYSDMGAIVTDNKDENLGYSVSTWKDGGLLYEGNAVVDTSTEGLFEIHYRAKDSDGNEAVEVIRQVIVGEEDIIINEKEIGAEDATLEEPLVLESVDVPDVIENENIDTPELISADMSNEEDIVTEEDISNNSQGDSVNGGTNEAEEDALNTQLEDKIEYEFQDII